VEHGLAGRAGFEAVGVQRLAAMVEGFRGMAFLYMGAPDEALEILRFASASFARLGAKNLVDMLRASVAEAKLDLGHVEEARRDARETAEATARIGDWVIEGRVREILSRALLDEAPAEAEAEASRAAELLAPARPFRALALASVAEARRAHGDVAGALAASAEAVAIVEEIEPLLFIAGRVRLARARALREGGDADGARRVIEDARARLASVAATIADPARRDGWERKVAPHRAILDWSEG
jgi:hypothetical protein